MFPIAKASREFPKPDNYNYKLPHHSAQRGGCSDFVITCNVGWSDHNSTALSMCVHTWCTSASPHASGVTTCDLISRPLSICKYTHLHLSVCKDPMRCVFNQGTNSSSQKNFFSLTQRKKFDRVHKVFHSASPTHQIEWFFKPILVTINCIYKIWLVYH